MSADDTPEQTMKEDEDYTTTSPQTRWEGLNTALALILVLSLVSIISYVIVSGASLSTVGQAWFLLYSFVVLMAATWAFGKETLEAVQKARGKP